MKLRNTTGAERTVNVGQQPWTLRPYQEREIDATFAPGEEERVTLMGDIEVDGKVPGENDDGVFTGDDLARLSGEDGVRALGEQSVDEGRDPANEGGLVANSADLAPGQTMGQQAPTGMETARYEQLRAAVAKLTEGVDFTQDGTPKVDSLNAVIGDGSTVSAAERDIFWATMQSEQD